ncbi:MAG: Cell division coordinator CpoB [Calditrichaeota bacterium]|nr:Cell division coordinator CpoB [Calditrichota bacterium]
MRRGMTRTVLLAALIASFAAMIVTGCGRGRRYEDLSMDNAWQRINTEFANEDYLDASDHLEIFIINYAGSTISDSAQYLLAECHYRMKEYIIAASEYRKLVSQYPRSPLVAEAEFKLGESHYELSPHYAKDQEYTEKAIDTFQLFIEDFPDSDRVPEATEKIDELRAKLAKKEFRSGRLYHKMGEYESARIYYQSVLDNYYDTEYAEQAQLFKAESWAGQKKWEEAVAAYRAFLSRYPDSEHTAYVQEELEQARVRYRKQLQREREREREGEDEELSGAFLSD